MGEEFGDDVADVAVACEFGDVEKVFVDVDPVKLVNFVGKFCFAAKFADENLDFDIDGVITEVEEAFERDVATSDAGFFLELAVGGGKIALTRLDTAANEIIKAFEGLF